MIRPRLTHVAIRARDVQKSIDFYQRLVGLHIVHDRTDDGVRVVWLSEQPEDPNFVIVIIGIPPDPRPVSLAEHLGYDVPSRAAVDEIAARGDREGVLLQGPMDGGPIVGYFCMLSDPDGNVIEFSHGQPINPKQLR
jgi:catechol 2,3-dioxygenase-like lactoylglutathione lyase family enzyme